MTREQEIEQLAAEVHRYYGVSGSVKARLREARKRWEQEAIAKEKRRHATEVADAWDEGREVGIDQQLKRQRGIASPPLNPHRAALAVETGKPQESR